MLERVVLSFTKRIPLKTARIYQATSSFIGNSGLFYVNLIEIVKI